MGSQTRVLSLSGIQFGCGSNLLNMESTDLLLEILRKIACYYSFIFSDSSKTMFQCISISSSRFIGCLLIISQNIIDYNQMILYITTFNYSYNITPYYYYIRAIDLLIKQIKVMFLTLQSFHKKQHYRFSNKLAGKSYDNSLFVYSCSREIDKRASTICTQDTQFLKQTKRHSSKDINCGPKSKISNHLHRRNIKSSHTQYEPFLKDEKLDDPSQARPKTHNIDQLKYLQMKESKKRKLMKRYNSKQPQEVIFTQIKENQAKKLMNLKTLKKQPILKPYLMSNNTLQIFKFPQIKLKILDKFSSLEDIQMKSISINSQLIFSKLIKKQLMGSYTKYFMETIQYYIRIIFTSKQVSQESKLESFYKNISKKTHFVEKIKELRENGELEKILNLVKYYCIPPESQCKKILQDFILDLTVQMYQNRNCKKNIQYLILTEEGKEINNIAQIYFSTESILIVPQESSRQVYSLYQELINEDHKLKKLNFRELLKRNFVQNIVKHKIAEKVTNNATNEKQMSEYRKVSVWKAQGYLISRSKLRLQPRKQITLQQNTSREDQQNFICESPDLQKTKRENVKREYNQIVKQLRRILDPLRTFPFESKSEHQVQLQFKNIFSYNQLYIKNYNAHEDNQNKLLVDNLLQNFYIFQNKSQQQKQCLSTLINRMYGKNQMPLKQISFWQFKELYQGIYGIADKSIIMNIVNSYFDFDDYGELSKPAFENNLSICTNRKGRKLNIIVQTLWIILQKHKVVDNNCISKYKLQVWYEPIKFLYFLLLSIIFGTEYISMEEMIIAILGQTIQ